MSMGFVHDLNNILGPIVAYAELAATTIAPGGKTARYIEQITRAAERGRALATRWAELARDREPKRSLVDMAEIAREIVGWLRVTRPDLRIELSCDEIVTTVVGDPVQLHQVVLNLAQNGAEALSDRAGSLTIRIDHAKPDEATSGHYLRLEVRDDGRGIDEGIEARIFDPFFSTRTEGSGLGLNVSRAIVLAHNGVIRLERSSPKGTTATVFLPVAPCERRLGQLTPTST
jgi:signal transduction histidine kinase